MENENIVLLKFYSGSMISGKTTSEDITAPIVAVETASLHGCSKPGEFIL